MDETRNGSIPAAVRVGLRPTWGGACETLAVDVGNAPALVVVTDENEDGTFAAMTIDATGPEDVDELIQWLRLLAASLEAAPRFDA